VTFSGEIYGDLCSGFNIVRLKLVKLTLVFADKVKSDSTSLRRCLPDIYLKHIIHQLWPGIAGLQGFDFWQGKGFFSLPHNSYRFWGLCNGYWAFFPPKKIKQPEHEDDPSPPSVVGVNRLGAIPPFYHILSKYGAWTQKSLYFHWSVPWHHFVISLRNLVFHLRCVSAMSILVTFTDMYSCL
jgi:hypothetical protein